MQIRRGTPDPDDFDAIEDDDDGDEAPDPAGTPLPGTPLTSAQWRIDRTMLAAKVIGIVAFAAVPQVFEFNPASRWFGAAVAVALSLYALRDLVAPVRLSADRDGVRVVSGFARHRDIPWSDVERMRLDTRRRAGFLEIETADTVTLLSRYDLGMLPIEALAMLEEIRPTGA